jgi:hypothetical protein
MGARPDKTKIENKKAQKQYCLKGGDRIEYGYVGQKSWKI